MDRGLSTDALSLLNGSTLTHRLSRVADGPTGVPRLEIDATSSIDVTAKGYPGNGRGDNNSSRGRTIGNATGSSRGGGSYGGRGGDLSNGVYGDYRDPNHLGSGGGGNNSGGAGGGLVRITADTLVVDGAVRANGGLGGAGIGSSSGNGSGGGVRIDTRILSGDGVISAEGGEESSRQGGGGGRIAIYYQDISGLIPATSALGRAGWWQRWCRHHLPEGHCPGKWGPDHRQRWRGVPALHGAAVGGPWGEHGAGCQHPHRQRSQLLRAQPRDGQGGVDRARAEPQHDPGPDLHHRQHGHPDIHRPRRRCHDRRGHIGGQVYRRPRPGQPGHRRARQGEHVGSADRGEWQHPQPRYPGHHRRAGCRRAWCWAPPAT